MYSGSCLKCDIRGIVTDEKEFPCPDCGRLIVAHQSFDPEKLGKEFMSKPKWSMKGFLDLVRRHNKKE